MVPMDDSSLPLQARLAARLASAQAPQPGMPALPQVAGTSADLTRSTGGPASTAPEAGGIVGPAPTAPAADPSLIGGPVGAFGNAMSGYDSSKLASKNDPKYEIGRVLSQFDPTGGITPDVLTALNKLGIGQFSGSGDKLAIANGTSDLAGNLGGDFIQGFHSGHPSWQYDYTTAGGPAPAASPYGAMAGLNPMLGGSANANINAALKGIGGIAGNSANTLQQLIAALSPNGMGV